jgi:hypothetical protein
MEMLGRLKFYLIRATVFLMPLALIVGLSGFDCNGGGQTPPSQNLEIRTWYDLDQVRHNLAGNHTLMNDLDSSSAGYEELASPTANEGKGWQPIGYETMEGGGCGRVFFSVGLKGTFEGQGYEIRDLFINRPEAGVGLLAYLVRDGIIRNVGLVNVDVTGAGGGSLVGSNEGGTIHSCYSTGNVAGTYVGVGGLVGWNGGVVSGSHSSGSVTGGRYAGGLIGSNEGTVSSSYSTAGVTGDTCVGGLVGGSNGGTVSDCYSSGSVTGSEAVGGLAGSNYHSSTVSNSHSSSSVTGTTAVGGLVGDSLYYGGTVSGSYFTGSVTGDAEVGGLVGNIAYCIVDNAHYDYDAVTINGGNLLTIGALYGEDFAEWLDSDRFLDVGERLSQEDGYYLINNVTDFKQLLAFGQNGALRFRLTDDLDLSNEPGFYIPYLAGEFDGNGHRVLGLSLSYDRISGLGLFGYLAPGGNVTRVRAENVNVRGHSAVGALVGLAWESAVSESYCSGIVTGSQCVGGLVGESIGGTVSSSYSIANVAGEYDVAGLMGRSSGTVGNSCSAGSVFGNDRVGGLIGWNLSGAVTGCRAAGIVTGTSNVGGLVGVSTGSGSVSDSYTTGRVIGNDRVGGLIGTNADGGAVVSCYAAGSVTGISNVGGLVGHDYLYYGEGTVSGSFWDIEASGQAASAGGTGTSSVEMKTITIFSDAGWSIVAVADPGARNASSVWNIVDLQTYPFLSWQPLT